MMSMSVRGQAAWETRLLIVVTAILVVFGIAAVYGASSIVALQQGQPGSVFAWRQVAGVLIGSVCLLVGSRVDYRVWQRWAWPVLGVTTVLLLVLLLPFTGSVVLEVNGARRWVILAGVSFQPAEVAKFAIVAWTAMVATKKGARVREFKRGVFPFIVIIAPVAIVILLEPALSMALLVVLLAGIVLFSAGARIGHFLVIGVVMLPFLWRQVATVQYRLQRWLSFFGPGTESAESGWQIQQSLIGIGSGQFFGVGFGQGTQKMGYLPYGYSDFIFSTIGEEWGFLGVGILIALFATFVGVGFRIARTAPDRFGTLLGIGLTSLVGVTAVLHIAVTLGVVPATGLPLPFVSYGRSNLIVSMFATGVLVNIGTPRARARRR